MPTSPDELGALILRTIKRALEPLAARLAAAERRVEALDVGPLLARLAAAETRLEAAERTGRDLAVALEAAGGRLAVLEPLGPVREAVAGLEARLLTLPATVEVLAAVRERLAALEARPPVPGPAGPAGADGLGFEDLAVDVDDAHTVTLRFTAGDRVKAFPLTLPFLVHRGVYREGTAYDRGDVVTWAGSLWHCQAAGTTARPGLVTSAAAWILIVKCGRDGKDGQAGPIGPVGPAGKDWNQVYDAMRAR